MYCKVEKRIVLAFDVCFLQANQLNIDLNVLWYKSCTKIEKV